MLIRFNVKNFLSFAAKDDNSSEEFSMIAGKVRNKKEHLYDDGKIKLLKFAAIYGANASGKSNLVKAMNFMKQVVINGLPDGHTEKYCRIEPNNKNKPSYFEMEISLNGRYYAYGFELILNKSKFISEWLYEIYPDNTENVIFVRDINHGSYELNGLFKDKNLLERLNIYIDDIRCDSTTLFMNTMNRHKENFYQSYKAASIFKELFTWISKCFDVNYPNQPISNYSYLISNNKIAEVGKIISAFGTGITKLQVVDVPIDKVLSSLPPQLQKKILSDVEKKQVNFRNKKIKKANIVMRTPDNFFIIIIDSDEHIKCQTIEFCHGKDNILFNLEEESDGTVRIMDLLEILIAGEGKTYVVDELDRCLHPSLTYRFVETFFQIAKDKNIQLIVTTHESRLMDFDLLRRDEIWFINKQPSGASDIYSLEEYNERFDKKIDKAYLDGRYGGVPIFSTIFPIEE